jgi:hypothetical protein
VKRQNKAVVNTKGSIMHHKHQLSSTTHTVEMAQIAELNGGLRESKRAQAISASLLGLQGVEASSGSEDDHSLPGDAFLVGISFDGPPAFPYVHAQFGTDPSDHGSLTVDLHTGALRKLSHLLNLRHVWGAGNAGTAENAPP